MISAGKAIDLPDIDPFEYMVEYFAEIGLALSSEMGIAPLNWREVSAWSEMALRPLNHWEAETIVLASRAYVSAAREYDCKSIPSPIADPQEQRKTVSNQLRAAFAALTGGKND